MKTRRNLLVASLVLLMMITAVGYAAWTDTLEVSGTVNTGKFDVYFNQIAQSDYKQIAGGIDTNTTIFAETIDQTNSIHDKDDKVSITITNAKPGDKFEIKVTAKNNGTVVANLSKLIVIDKDSKLTLTASDASNDNAFEDDYNLTFNPSDEKLFTLTVLVGDYDSKEEVGPKTFKIEFPFSQILQN